MKIIGKIGTGKSLLVREFAKSQSIPLISFRLSPATLDWEVWNILIEWDKNPKSILCFEDFQDAPSRLKPLIELVEDLMESSGRTLIIIESR